MARKRNSLDLLRSQIEQVFAGRKQQAFTFKQLMRELNLRGQDKKILSGELERMLKDGLLVKTSRAAYSLPRRMGFLTGTLQGSRRGYAFLRPEQEGEEDVYIRSSALKGAMHGDRVVVRLRDSGSRRRRREGEVTAILQRGNSRLVGTLEKRGKNCIVIPDERRLCREVLVSRKGLDRTKSGEKVMVEIKQWPVGGQPPQGQVVEYFGPADSPGAEQRALFHKYDLPGEFPAAVQKELETLPSEEDVAKIAAAEKRRDLRDLYTVTIDGDMARDFDDAVSLEMDGAYYRLGVHIADVSYYVREGRPLDREAFERGTSVYLVERAIHMLPPLLSENLCSLRAGRDRLALSVIMKLTPQGELIGYEFFPSLIRVDQRLTYRQVEACLTGRGEDPGFEGSLVEILARMDGLAAKLKERRLARGALDLDLPEAEITVDDEGNPLSIERRCMGRSESLIEEFMILCNEVVAAHVYRQKHPYLYRVHAVPTEEKLAVLKDTLLAMGLALPEKELKPKHLKRLLEQTRGQRGENLVRYMLLRSLPQARYSAFNEGHFGLASTCYTHFTSPIRRYPDLVNHRLLKRYLAGRLPGTEEAARLESHLVKVALHSSERERVAVEAERASEELKKVQYMESRLGDEYPGIISGVANFGIFVELDNTIEGMVPVSSMEDDYYVYHERQAALVGERTRKTYRLGDEVRVRVARVSRAESTITFDLV